MQKYAHLKNGTLVRYLDEKADLPWNCKLRCSRAVLDGRNINGDEVVIPIEDYTPPTPTTPPTAEELEAIELENLNTLRANMLEMHPELAVIFSGFLQICGVVNGLAPDDPDCKMGFPELINVKNSFTLLQQEDQVEVLARAVDAGFEGDTPKEIITEMSAELLALDAWGKRYDIMHQELASVGGWWTICEYIG